MVYLPAVIIGVNIVHLTTEDHLDAVLGGDYKLAEKLSDDGEVLIHILERIFSSKDGVCSKGELLEILSKDDIRKGQDRINKKYSLFFKDPNRLEKVLSPQETLNTKSSRDIRLLTSTSYTSEMPQGSVILLRDILVVNQNTNERRIITSRLK